MDRTGLWLLVVGVVSFLIGALGGQMLDTTFPIWIFTWVGLALVVAGAVVVIRRRRT